VTGYPVVRELPPEEVERRGLDHCWTAYANARGKPALTVELNGLRTIDRDCAKEAGETLERMVRAFADIDALTAVSGPLPYRTEVYADTDGLLEAVRSPGARLRAGEPIGVIRSYDGEEQVTVTAPKDGLLLSVQPVSAVHVGCSVGMMAVT
jgi:predicted deacylase